MVLGAFAIIQDGQGRFLISHRRDLDMWNLPGGGVEPPETPWEAVIREVREETGLTVAVRQLHGVYSKAGTGDLAFSFSCTIADGRLMLTDEADQHAFVEFAKIPKNFPPKQLDRLKDYLAFPDTTTLKTQDLPSGRDYLKSLQVEQSP